MSPTAAIRTILFGAVSFAIAIRSSRHGFPVTSAPDHAVAAAGLPVS
ncbi:MAG TPA: hypothetical protein V6C63_12395 [Allocoleopsis sp.]